MPQTFVFLGMHALNRHEVMLSNAPQRFDADACLADSPTRRRGSSWSGSSKRRWSGLGASATGAERWAESDPTA
jgi:hypothetical protein